jgi:hypothetical protein
MGLVVLVANKEGFHASAVEIEPPRPFSTGVHDGVVVDDDEAELLAMTPIAMIHRIFRQGILIIGALQV